jgi:hypothetical protein
MVNGRLASCVQLQLLERKKKYLGTSLQRATQTPPTAALNVGKSKTSVFQDMAGGLEVRAVPDFSTAEKRKRASSLRWHHASWAASVCDMPQNSNLLDGQARFNKGCHMHLTVLRLPADRRL